jgi:hypothetical protein
VFRLRKQTPATLLQNGLVAYLSFDHVTVAKPTGASLETATKDRLNDKCLKTLGIATVSRGTDIAESPDGRFLLAASDVGLLRIFTLAGDGKIRSLLNVSVAGKEWIAWADPGAYWWEMTPAYYACSPGGERLAGWRVDRGTDEAAEFYALGQFRKALYRPDVIKLLLKTASVEKALELADRERGKETKQTALQNLVPPRVRITSPAPGSKLEKSEVTVEAVAESVGEPVTALQLLLDGRPHGGASEIRRVKQPRRGEVRESWTLELPPGKHRLQVLADSAVSQGKSADIEVVYPGGSEEVKRPRLYVLAVGVSRYQDASLRLHYAASDAEAVVGAFETSSKALFREIMVHKVLDGDASRAGILKELGWLRREITQRDVGVVFFSGHGDKDTDGNLYFLPADVDPKDLPSSAVPAEQVKKMLTAMPGRILLLLDACHSGGIDGPKKKGGSLTDDLVRDLVSDENGLVVMCSSTGRESSLENNDKRRGNFTQALVEGLAGKGGKTADGAVYLHHLDAYVTDRVKELSRGQQHPVTARPASIRSFPLSKP